MPSPTPTLAGTVVEAAELMREIDAAIIDLQHLARSDVSRGEFYRRLLTRSQQTTSASWSGLWHLGGSHGPSLTHTCGSDPFRNRRGRAKYKEIQEALQERARTGTEGVLPVKSGKNSGTIIVGTIHQGDQPAAMLTYGYDEQLPHDVAVGLVQFVDRMAEFASRYEARRTLKALPDVVERWSRFANFTAAVHRDSSLQQVADDIANEGMRYLDCGRIAVSVHLRGRQRILSVSGLNRFHRQAVAVKLLQRLIDAVVVTGRPLCLSDVDRDLAPQIEKPLQAYVDEAAPRDLVVLPLHEPGMATGKGRRVGALVIENFDGQRILDVEDAVQRVGLHASIAITRACRLRSVPFLNRLLKAAYSRTFATWRRLPLWTLVIAGVIGVITAMCVCTGELEIKSQGVLAAVETQHIFAPYDGVIETIDVSHGATVAEGTKVATIRSTELELQLERLQGETEVARKELDALRADSLQQDGRSPEGEKGLRDNASRELILQKKLENFAAQDALLRRQLRELEIHAPITGEVVTWDPQRTLASRPVRRGERLMTIANLDGPWVLRLRTPDRSVGHVLKAREARTDNLDVEFVLASDPEQTYAAKLVRIADASEFAPEDGEASVLVEAEFAHDAVPYLRPDATVHASIKCGKRSLAFIWFHEAYEELCRKFF